MLGCSKCMPQLWQFSCTGLTKIRNRKRLHCEKTLKGYW